MGPLGPTFYSHFKGLQETVTLCGRYLYAVPSQGNAEPSVVPPAPHTVVSQVNMNQGQGCTVGGWPWSAAGQQRDTGQTKCTEQKPQSRACQWGEVFKVLILVIRLNKIIISIIRDNILCK